MPDDQWWFSKDEMQNVPYQDCEYPTNLKRNTSPIMILEDKTCKGSYFIETSRVVDNIFFAKFEFTPSLIEIVGVYLSFLMTRPISKYAPPRIKKISSHVCTLKNIPCTCLHHIKEGSEFLLSDRGYFVIPRKVLSLNSFFFRMCLLHNRT